MGDLASPHLVVGQPVARHVQGVLEVAVVNARLAIGADLREKDKKHFCDILREVSAFFRLN